jgi:hypothetical protein
MATTNTFITPSVLARTALATLYNSTVMLPLVTRDYDEAFRGAAVGDTVKVIKPPTLTANTYSQAVGIVPQNVTASSVDVKMDAILDVSVELTSLEQTLNLQDLQRDVLAPAMEAIAQAIDIKILGLRSDITSSVTATAYNVSTNPHPTYDLIVAGRKLTVAKVPLLSRYAVADPYLSSAWRLDQLSHDAEKRADGGTALRDAEIGRIHNFETYESNQITDFKGVAFHPSAFSFVTRPLELPKGAAYAAVETYKGLSVRVVWDYNVAYKKDVLSIDILCGVKTMDATRATLINGLADSV